MAKLEAVEEDIELRLKQAGADGVTEDELFGTVKSAGKLTQKGEKGQRIAFGFALKNVFQRGNAMALYHPKDSGATRWFAIGNDPFARTASLISKLSAFEARGSTSTDSSGISFREGPEFEIPAMIQNRVPFTLEVCASNWERDDVIAIATKTEGESTPRRYPVTGGKVKVCRGPAVPEWGSYQEAQSGVVEFYAFIKGNKKPLIMTVNPKSPLTILISNKEE